MTWCDEAIRPAPRLDAPSYGRLQAMLVELTGIKPGAISQAMLENRMLKRMRAIGISDHGRYCSELFDRGALGRELPHLIDAATINTTAFFREPMHFEALRRQLLPQLLDLRRREADPLIKVWSAAASNGSEAYSAAMVLADMAASSYFRYAVLGTDISTAMLNHARRAIYEAEAVDAVPAALRARFLSDARPGQLSGHVRVVPELRSRTSFSRLNLMDRHYGIDGDVDIIFLRNVLIYFEKADQRAVIARMMGHLRKGGFLVLSHTESMIGPAQELSAVGTAIFRKD